MRHNSIDTVLLPITTATSSSTGSVLNIPDGFIGAILCVQVTAASGTSPTLNVFVQDQYFPAGASDVSPSVGRGAGTAIFDDFAAFTQITGTATRVLRFSSSGLVGSANAASITTADYAIADGTLTAGSVRPGPLGNIWRVKYTIGGTSPSFTFNVIAKLLPWP